MTRPAARPDRALVVLGLVLAATAGAAVLIAQRVPYERTPIVYSAALLVLAAVPLAYAVWRRRFGIFDPIWPVLLFLVLQFPAQAIYLAAISDYANDLLPDRREWVELVNVALALCALAIVVFVAAYALAARPARWLGARVPGGTRVDMGRPLTRLIVAFSVAGLIGFAAFFVSQGGVREFVASLSAHNARSAGRFYLIWLATLFPIANLLWFTQRAVLRPGRRGLVPYLVHLAASVALLLSFGSRAQVLNFLELLIVVRFFCVRDIKVRHLVAFAAVGVVFLGIYGAYRQGTEDKLSDAEFRKLSPETQQIVRERERNQIRKVLNPRGLADQILQYDYSPLDTFVLLLKWVPEKFKYQYGATLLDVFVRPIPGALWPDKPKPLNTQYNQKLLGAERSGKKASILGEGWVNGNVAGIVLLLAALGVFARALVFYRARYASVGAAVLVYAIVYKFVWSMTGGGFGEVAMFTLMYLVPVGVAFWWASRSARRGPEPAPVAVPEPAPEVGAVLAPEPVRAAVAASPQAPPDRVCNGRPGPAHRLGVMLGIGDGEPATVDRARRLAEILRGAGHRVVALSVDGARAVDDLADTGADVHVAGRRSVLDAVRLVRRHKLDLVHAVDARAAARVGWAAALTARPLVVDGPALPAGGAPPAIHPRPAATAPAPERALDVYAPLVGASGDALASVPDPLDAECVEHTACDACGADETRVLFRAADYRYFTDDTLWTAVECTRCGLGYLDPRPTPDAIGKYYPPEYHASGREITGSRERYAREAAHLAGVPPGRLLDIGCARGDFAEVMRRRGWDVAGFDVADAGNPHGLDLRHGRFPEDCPFPDESFDAITAWAVLEHLHRPGAAFAAVARLLRPGGLFVLLVPNGRSVNSRFALREDVPRHLYFFSRADIEGYSARAGLVTTHYESNGEIYPASGRGVLRLWLWRALGFSDADFFRMLGASRLRRFRRHPVLAWVWHAVALLERVALSDRVLRRTGWYGTQVFHLRKPDPGASAGPMGTDARANVGRAVAEHVEGDCVTPVRHELNAIWPDLLAETLGSTRAPGVWLDVGCGTGAGRSLAERGGLTGVYVGLDLARAAEWEDATRRNGALRARFVACDVVDVDHALGAASADGAVSISAFEHFPDDAAALAAVARTLRPGARLVACVPSGWGRVVWGPRHGFHWYAPADLRRMAVAAGMELDDLRPVGGLGSVVLGVLWFLPGYLAAKLVTAVLLARHGGRRELVRRRHPWTGDLLLRLQFGHCRWRWGRRLHSAVVRVVSGLDRRARSPAPAWIAVLRVPEDRADA